MTENQVSFPAGDNPQHSLVSVEDRVLRIAVATSEHGTSLSPLGMEQGTAALRAAGSEIGAVLLVGEGANFCAGGNVLGFAAAEDRGAHLLEIANLFHDFVRELEKAPVPVVAAVHGWAAGAGMSLALLADIALAGPGTKMRAAYPSIGFSPDGGMSWTLPRIVGPSRAREIIMTDSVIGADEAVRLGLLSRLVADGEIQSEALRIARTLAHGPTQSYAAVRTLVAGSAGRSLSEQLDVEAAAISAAATTPTGIEGVDAFVAKRRPDWESVRN